LSPEAEAELKILSFIPFDLEPCFMREKEIIGAIGMA
jgi:hypothetical protein